MKALFLYKKLPRCLPQPKVLRLLFPSFPAKHLKQTVYDPKSGTERRLRKYLNHNKSSKDVISGCNQSSLLVPTVHNVVISSQNW